MQKQYISYLFIVFFLSFSFARVQAQGNTNIPGLIKGVAGSGSDSIGSTLSLPQAVAIAIKNSLAVNTYDLYMQQDKINLNQAWDNLLPTFSGSANQNMGFGRSLNTYNYTYVNQQTNSGNYNINAGLTLFNGLYLQNTIRQNSYYYAAGKMDLQNQKDQITLSIILDYLQVLSAQDALVLTREQADVDAKQLARLDSLSKAGWRPSNPFSDLPNLQGQYAADLANIATAESTLEIAKITLFTALNVPYKREVEYDRGALVMQLTDYQESPDNIFQMALQVVPAVKAADLRVKSYQKALQAARGLYYPTLSFGAGINTYYNNTTMTTVPGAITEQPTGDFVTVGGTQYNVIGKQESSTSYNTSFGDQFNNNRSYSLGLTLSIPILSGLQRRNNVKTVKINLKTYEVNANNTRLALQQYVEQAYQYMILAYKTYKSDIDQAAAFAEAFRITEIQFNEGVIGVDANIYLPAKRLADQAKLALAQAKYTYIFRTKVLDYYQGRLSL